MRESDETSGEMNTREAKPCEGGEGLLLRHRLKANFGFSFFLSFPDYSDYSYERRDFDSRAWNSMEFLYFFFFFRGRAGCNTVFYDFRTLSRRNNLR